MEEIKKRERAKFNYTGRYIALVCNNCGETIKLKHFFTKEENDAYMFDTYYPPQYCTNCKNKTNE
jgi:hypothetical protein